MTQPLHIHNEATRDRAAAFVGALSVEGKRWTVEVKPYRKRRSLDQNALHWKHMTLIAAETGHTPEEIHEFVKARFLPPVPVEIQGELREVRRSTTKLTTKEMSELIDRTVSWAATDLGIALPLPEDQFYGQGA